MKMRICSVCGAEKSAGEYHRRVASGDGLRRQCKACVRIYAVSHAKEIADSQRAYSQTAVGKITRCSNSKRHRLKHPEKEKAKNAVGYAIHTGVLYRSVYCEKCGLPAKTQAHHADYSKLLSVQWLCPRCHSRTHTR